MTKKIKYESVLKTYITFLKKNKLYDIKKKFFYENNIEKFQNWSNGNFKQKISWYKKIKKNNKSKVKDIHIEKMKNWTYDKNSGVISHNSGEFFCIEGKRITNSNREVDSWDQPFIKQIGYKGGIIGLVRALIKGVPHYLIDAKFEPGNYNEIQLSPSLQATYSNLNRVHLGSKPKVANKYFKKILRQLENFGLPKMEVGCIKKEIYTG
jgi:oxidase EvaA